jgi:hypothetical protein
MTRRETIVERVLAERVRQFDLPGTEYDVANTPNDWAAIAASYLLRSVARKNTKPSAEDYEQDLTMAAAVILAGLEHLDQMKEKGLFGYDSSQEALRPYVLPNYYPGNP